MDPVSLWSVNFCSWTLHTPHSCPQSTLASQHVMYGTMLWTGCNTFHGKPLFEKGVSAIFIIFQLCSTLWPKQCRHQITQWLLDHVSALANKGSLVVPILTIFSCLQHLAALRDMAGSLHKLHHPAGTSWDKSLGWSHVSKLIYRQQDAVAKHDMMSHACMWRVLCSGSVLLAACGIIRPWTEVCMHDLCSTCREVQDASKLS